MTNSRKQVFNWWQKFQNYGRFWWKSVHIHGVHSPFVFELYNEAIADDRYFYSFDYVETIRQELREYSYEIEVQDYGSGSVYGQSKKRSTPQLLKSASNPKQGQLLFRLVNFLQPKTIVELGTHLGIGTLYLAEASPKDTQIYTFEGCPNVGKLAQKIYAHTHLKINTIIGNLDKTLAPTLTEIPSVDLVYFDANHRLEPTLQYFEAFLPKINENSVFIFDDIYYSEEMKQAWKAICKHSEVKISIDLFDVGIVLFRENQPKQHFCLKF